MQEKNVLGIQIFESNYNIYIKYSNQLFNLLLEYTDVIERFSIDECFLDLTNFLSNNDILENKAIEIKERVKKELGFTVNVGVSTNKLLAKMASDFQKPDRVHTLFENEIKEKMWNLPISDLFMVGRKMFPKLQRIGIYTIGDLAKKDKNNIIALYGKYGKMIWEYANGIDEAEVNYLPEKPKSIGNSVTLPIDVSDISQLEEVIVALSEQVSYRLRKEDLLATVVNVQLRTKNFEDFSHQAKLDCATSSTKEILKNAVMVMPTAGGTFTREQVREDPVKTNSLMGLYTNHCNLLDLMAVAVPENTQDKNLPFGITIFGLADSTNLVLQTAESFLKTESIDFAVCGLHKKGYALESQLTELGAEYIESTATAKEYKLYKLNTNPIKPGLVRAENGENINVDIFKIPVSKLGSFMSNVSTPLSIGNVELIDGRWVKGFLCEEYAVKDAEDITSKKSF